MNFIDRIPLVVLIIASVFLLGAPFMPEPHSIEKLRMLMDGSLTKPIDIFDLIWHFTPVTLLFIRLYRMRTSQKVK